MTSRYFKDLDHFAEADVIIVGAGSAGLTCAYELSKIAPDRKVRPTYLVPVPTSSSLQPTIRSRFCPAVTC